MNLDMAEHIIEAKRTSTDISNPKSNRAVFTFGFLVVRMGLSCGFLVVRGQQVYTCMWGPGTPGPHMFTFVDLPEPWHAVDRKA